MNTAGNRSLEITDIIGDVVKSVSADCHIMAFGADGYRYPTACPEINYVFGNGEYVKDRLDELSQGCSSVVHKLPMIALFMPYVEVRDSNDYYAKSTIRVMIACSTSQEWSNEQRRDYSFEGVLRPIYRKFIEALKSDSRLTFGASECVEHEYRENYSIGRYGALAPSGEVLSEPIDAIEITKLKLQVRNFNCRLT